MTKEELMKKLKELEEKSKNSQSEYDKKISELQKKNIEDIYLWCEDKNIKLYENIGFSIYGHIYIKREE